MSKLNKIMIGIWACLAIMSFVCAFFCPLFPKIVGLAFGCINILTIFTASIASIQSLYYNIEMKKRFEDELQLQETSETKSKEAEVRG